MNNVPNKVLCALDSNKRCVASYISMCVNTLICNAHFIPILSQAKPSKTKPSRAGPSLADVNRIMRRVEEMFEYDVVLIREKTSFVYRFGKWAYAWFDNR